MAALARAAGLAVACRSRNEALTPTTDIYIADTMGELGLFYRVCDLVFIGKSLAVGGGQNPAEAALMGCAVVMGPNMSNFRDMTRTLVDAGAAIQIGTAPDLTKRIDELLGDPALRSQLGATARAFMAAHGQSLDAALAEITPLMTGPYPGRPEIN